MQGSADDAGQEGPLGGADAAVRKKDKFYEMVLNRNSYKYTTQRGAVSSVPLRCTCHIIMLHKC